MSRTITPTLLLAAMLAPATAAADSRPAPAPSPVRTVHLEITDPGDPGGALELTTSLVGERACTGVELAEGPSQRKLDLCVLGPAGRSGVEVHLERRAAGHTVDVRFAALAPAGKRTRVGRVTLGAGRVLEAHATVTLDAP